MDIFSSLKFLLEDKEFVNNKFVKQIGGRQRIERFLELDAFIEKQIEFYKKELNKNEWTDEQEEKSFLSHILYFEQVLRMEVAFLEQLQRLEHFWDLNREAVVIYKAHHKLFVAARMMDKKFRKWRQPNMYTFMDKIFFWRRSGKYKPEYLHKYDYSPRVVLDILLRINKYIIGRQF